MKSQLFVISDLHLGGAPADPAVSGDHGFQITAPATRALLAAFIDRLPASTDELDCRLVIAGDIVDFLAEQDFSAFTLDPAVALAKLKAIVAGSAPVWDALRRFVGERRGALTLMLGNHDIELSLHDPRRWLLDRIGPGRVDCLFDNEAFVQGPVLIEHGNRFDPWNAVPHDALRRVRSQQSRRLPVRPDFPALPGSRLVVDVMNGLKRDYAFIDLLKPEDACALPIAAALGAGSGRDIWKFYKQFRQQHQIDYDEEGEPVDPQFIRATVGDDQAMYDLAQRIAAGGDPQRIGAVGNLLAAVGGVITEQVRKARREALFLAFRGILERPQRSTFELDREARHYLLPARRSAAAGFQVVVYGHTHLAKRVALDTGAAVYLNSGTWADLMRLPDAIGSWDADAARLALEAFVDDLSHNRLDNWRRSVPTYARIDLDDEAVTHADIHFGDDDSRVTSAAFARRLQGRPVDD